MIFFQIAVFGQDVSTWVEQRVKDWRPTPEERRLDSIAWAKDLPEALRLARQNGRPTFLFTYSGSSSRPNAIALQRC